MRTLPKLLYLGFAFPPGVAGRFPEAQPAGHLVETSLINSLRPWFEIRSVGISWIDVAKVASGDPSGGLPHALNLLEKKPELLSRWLSLSRLKSAYASWVQSGWRPEIVLMCNFSPVYNGFIRWLARQGQRPLVILYLADSMTLQRELDWATRLRYHLKPLKWPDADMVRFIDACVAVSRSTEQFFTARGLPWFWLPNGCDPRRAIRSDDIPANGPIQFGYVGTLAAHGGVPNLLSIFTAKQRHEVLHICGFGKTRPAMSELCRSHPQLRFHDPRTPDECVKLAHSWDVLVNPRPIVQGNENNFSSKIFEYALSRRPILTSRLSGIDRVLGDLAYYFDAADFDRSLDQMLTCLARTPRFELSRRGASIQEHVLARYTWTAQGERLAGFLNNAVSSRDGLARPDAASSPLASVALARQA